MKQNWQSSTYPGGTAQAPLVIVCLVLGIAALFPAALLYAQPETLMPADSQMRSEEMLVLDDGRIVRGMITVLENGYAIQMPAGNITIPFEMVVCQAKTLTEAYRKQRHAIIRPTAEQHTRLAQWCVQNRLFAEAELELNSALRLQPNHQPALKLVRLLTNQQPKKSDFENKQLQATMDKLLIQKEFGDVRPIGDLPPELAQEFVRVIEPLVMANCSNTSCHGREAQNDFILTHKWNLRGNTRHITEQNLRAVLGFIRPDSAENSPFLQAFTTPHGPQQQPILAGHKAREYQLLLENWTLKTSRHLAPPTPAPTSSIEQISGTMPQPTGNLPPENLPITQASTPVEDAQLQQQSDPFDPALFNLQKHRRP